MHFAQFNIARLIAPENDPRIAGFVGNISRIHALADRIPGFVWRNVGLGAFGGDAQTRLGNQMRRRRPVHGKF